MFYREDEHEKLLQDHKKLNADYKELCVFHDSERTLFMEVPLLS